MVIARDQFCKKLPVRGCPRFLVRDPRADFAAEAAHPGQDRADLVGKNLLEPEVEIAIVRLSLLTMLGKIKSQYS